MDIFLTIIAVIVIFSVLVLVHEYGHFLAARRAGIKVLEFGIGFPPRLFKKKVGETLYTINAIPFGGFVKLYGEDATNKDIINDKRSFAHKSPWTRTKVVAAGVLMNFLLAVVLLTIGFSVGIEPLLVNEQDLFAGLSNGTVKTAPGVFVKNVSDAAKGTGLVAGDQILAVDDQPITSIDQLGVFEKGGAKKDVDVSFIVPTTAQPTQGNQPPPAVVIKKAHLPFTGKDGYLGIDLKTYTELPRLTIFELKPGSASGRAGLKTGDVILQINGHDIFLPEDFESALGGVSTANFSILRGSETKQISVQLPDQRRVIISDVVANSVAAKAGLQKGDVLISVDGKVVTEPQSVIDILQKSPHKEMSYELSRKGSSLTIKAKTDDTNKLGVELGALHSFRNSEISVYRGSLLTSITEIKKVHYAPWTAFGQALSESVRLTGLTISAFGKTIVSLVSKFAVPSDIGGPVQIAYYTHSFVQEGIFALIRFTALLSLSLAVINVLPIPALDGGRLLFIIIEVIMRKRVNARFEAVVHAIGFILLMGLIVLVTYSDIRRLF